MRKVFTTLFAVTVLVALAVNASAANGKPIGGFTKIADGITATFVNSSDSYGKIFYISFDEEFASGTLTLILHNGNYCEDIATYSTEVWCQFFAEMGVLTFDDVQSQIRYIFTPAGEEDCICDYQLMETVDATCTEAGYEYYECSKCGDPLFVAIPALGHKFDDLSDAKFVSFVEPIKNSNRWVLTFSAETYCSRPGCGEYDAKRNYTVIIISDNPNPAGSLILDNGDTLVYDLKGNTSNIKTVTIVKN